MKKIIIGIIILSLFAFLYFSRLLNYPINNFLNNTFAGKPNVSCVNDDDCKLVSPGCGCDCPIAVNVKWSPYCPLSESVNRECDQCTISFGAICQNGTCEDPIKELL